MLDRRLIFSSDRYYIIYPVCPASSQSARVQGKCDFLGAAVKDTAEVYVKIPMHI